MFLVGSTHGWYIAKGALLVVWSLYGHREFFTARLTPLTDVTRPLLRPRLVSRDGTTADWELNFVRSLPSLYALDQFVQIGLRTAPTAGDLNSRDLDMI
jgi:hypothetical protein